MSNRDVLQLEDVPLRDVWPDEARDFTPWLASNVDRLAEVLAMDLELVGAEMAVGPFACDVVLRDASTDEQVIVENFLEATDHDHLGKLLTYAAGFDAGVAVLVAKRFRPEHRSALMWLNEQPSRARFFGLEARAVRIGDSPPAALFDVVVKPDDWSREIKASQNATLSETGSRYQTWWDEFLQAMHERYPGWTSASKPPTTNWMNFPSGNSGLLYGVNFSWATGETGYSLRTELYMREGAKTFPQLAAHREEIDRALPGLVWEPIETAKASRVALYRPDADPGDVDHWPTYREWALDSLGQLRNVLQPFVDVCET